MQNATFNERLASIFFVGLLNQDLTKDSFDFLMGTWGDQGNKVRALVEQKLKEV
jgi:hypothetical protein